MSRPKKNQETIVDSPASSEHIKKPRSKKSEASNQSTKRKQTEQENKDLDILYQYIKNDILHYDPNIALPSFIVLRLKGMAQSTFLAKELTDENPIMYGYNLVYQAFYLQKDKILWALKTHTFKNENQKFAYISKIAESELPKLALIRYQAQQTMIHKQVQQEQIDEMLMASDENDQIVVKKQEKNKAEWREKYDGMW